VEGHEIEVLRGCDFSRWRPRLVFLEDHVDDLRLHRFMQARGYKWIRRTSINGWYVPQDLDWPLGLASRWQFFRKYHLGTPVRRLRDRLRRFRARFAS
jgi:hypothetical protein